MSMCEMRFTNGSAVELYQMIENTDIIFAFPYKLSVLATYKREIV